MKFPRALFFFLAILGFFEGMFLTLIGVPQIIVIIVCGASGYLGGQYWEEIRTFIKENI